MTSDAESSEEEWEDVEETRKSADDESENVEVTVAVSETVKKKWNKADWEREMVETSIRRAIKRFKKESQLDMHKVHLLSLLALGMRLNEICNDQLLLASVFSLLPERYANQKKNHVSAIFLTRFMQDFTKVFRFQNGVENLINCGHVRQPKIYGLLLKVLENKEIRFRIDLVLIVVIALRAMGLETRLVLSLQPLPLKALTEKNKENASKAKETTQKKTTNRKKRKSDASIPQVDGPSDSPPKRITRSRAKASNNNENAPPVKEPKGKTKIDSQQMVKKHDSRKSKVLKPISRGKKEDPEPTEIVGKKMKTHDVKETSIKKVSTGQGRQSKTSKIANKTRTKIEVEEQKQSEDEFDPASSDSDDSDFEVKSKIVRKSVSKARKSISTTMQSKDNSASGKPQKVTSRRSTGNLKKTGNDACDDAWIEVYSDQESQWLCIDVFRNIVNHPEKMEHNATKPLHYVLGYDNNGHVKDVTARYSSKWLTDTRKLRVGIVDKDWWKNTLAPYATNNKDRDSKENQDLQKKLLSQPMPTAIGAFKNHPLFALRRHLLKYEAIYPPDVPALGLIRGEEILPRSAIHTLHTRDKWLQEARVVKDAEEPYKMVASLWINMKLKQDMATLSMPLFGVWQTEAYVAPIAENGKVPRNRYGNVDLFKPEMMPVGCIKLTLPGIQKVARKLNIDIAAAVTGFDSHSGYPHPVTDGFVVCQEFEQVLRDAWREDQIHAAEREQKKREERIYGRWKLLIKGALAKERISRKYSKAQSDINMNSTTAWQSKRLKEARNKSKPRKRGTRSKKDDNLLSFETETM